MSDGVPWRALVQTLVLVVVLVLARYTAVFDGAVGRVVAAAILVVVGVDIALYYWRRYGA
ncbi:MAG: hypothetical protein ABEJ57_02885 [Halobacteriaceae archaeon]